MIRLDTHKAYAATPTGWREVPVTPSTLTPTHEDERSAA